MKVVKPSVELLYPIDGEEILRHIEAAARTCYKTEDKVTEDSYKGFIERLIKRKHGAMLEFGNLAVRVICDRGVTHEIVRHRLFSYAQESTRYCNYSKDKFGNELTFIKPCFWSGDGKFPEHVKYTIWQQAMLNAERDYLLAVEYGATPQEARAILPNSLKTEICISGNIREWIHFFELRTAPEAHPQMIEVAKMILELFKSQVPIVFDNI